MTFEENNQPALSQGTEKTTQPDATAGGASPPLFSSSDERSFQQPDTSEKLATDLDDFAQDVAPYGYCDAVEDTVAAIEENISNIENGGEFLAGIKNFLKSFADDPDLGTCAEQAQSLLNRICAYEEEHHTAVGPDPLTNQGSYISI